MKNLNNEFILLMIKEYCKCNLCLDLILKFTIPTFNLNGLMLMKPIILLSLLGFVSVFSDTKTTLAQTYQPSNRIPVADNTLGTQVSGTGNNFDITGGLSRGQTLFHSFTDFSIPTAGAATFSRPGATRDIITRVTGISFSDINGLINSNGANFFLVNSNGIVFGTNAQLNVGRAFMASTANGIELVDGKGGRYTFGTNGNGDAPLLSIDPNVFLNISRLNMSASVPGNRALVNYGTLQTNNDSQYIGLIGGNVTLDGGKIVAPGGRVDLGGLNSAGTVSTDSQGLVFGGSGLTYGDVLLTNGGQIDVRATTTLSNVNIFFNDLSSVKSGINVNANNVRIIGDTSISNPSQVTGLSAGFSVNSGIQNLPSGDININAAGKVTLDRGVIRNPTGQGVESQGTGSININASELEMRNVSGIVSDTLGKGNAGDIKIVSTGNITIADRGTRISSSSSGQGNTGKISIATPGKLSLNNGGNINNGIDESGVGNSRGTTIQVGELELRNGSAILSSTLGQGNGGDIDIRATGNISISGSDTSVDNLSFIASDSQGKRGDAGKISITTQGKLSLDRSASIGSAILGQNTVGNGGKITIQARELEIGQNSDIDAKTYGMGKAGDIDISTLGNISVSNGDISNTPFPSISTTTYGQGDAGKITINTQGKISLNNVFLKSEIYKDAIGNSLGITINAGEAEILNNSKISSNTFGKGDAGIIVINTQGNLSLINGGAISSGIGSTASGNSQGININIGNLNLVRESGIVSSNVGGTGNAGNIDINSKKNVNIIDNSLIVSSITGNGKAGNISINSQKLNLNSGKISSFADSVSGGDIILNISDIFILRNNSLIATDSFGNGRNSNGGNITINSSLIVATPGDSDITANAEQGTGGRVNITSQGLFGIQYRPKGQDSPLTNDITSSSTFGQDGTVNIDTPGTDPGKDSTELPNVPTDASTQISQACGANTRQNKLTVTGRGGLPPNAKDPLTADVVWQDTRATKSQPAASSETTNLDRLPPPAVGWVFDGRGKVTLVAAGIQGQQTGTSVACPNVVGK